MWSPALTHCQPLSYLAKRNLLGSKNVSHHWCLSLSLYKISKLWMLTTAVRIHWMLLTSHTMTAKLPASVLTEGSVMWLYALAVVRYIACLLVEFSFHLAIHLVHADIPAYLQIVAGCKSMCRGKEPIRASQKFYFLSYFSGTDL